ncbi:fringe glycosyltransferase-like [Oppia nitens]|uniref:fringe glycosyltransferase-like n=1 Tax=Oppia nitens TaxID=1686743 RepID=UPI0023DA5A2C|nr:fringe glycosyltransferase-like [Oppia nitens]
MGIRASKLAQKIVLMAFGVCYAFILFIWLSSINTLTLTQSGGQWSSDQLNTGHQRRNSFSGYQERAARSIFEARDSSVQKASNNNNNVNNNKNLSPKTTLNDIFISVKTTKKFHTTRLESILKTWFKLANNQTYFFTDAEDIKYNNKTGGHLINTNCSSSHNRRALCCKMSVEFDTFIDSNKRWFCHLDDDNYLNVPQLVRLLENYSPLQDWYLGKPSIRQPLQIVSRDGKQDNISFWFATGGAGFCISRSLALKMVPLASGGKFISIGDQIRLPDDVTIGYIVERLLNKKLTVVDGLHSHLEAIKVVNRDQLRRVITLSYSQMSNIDINTL